MSTTKYEISIASVPDRDYVVAEIWVEDNLFAEIRREDTGTFIEVYPHPTGQPWSLECDRLSSILSEANARLNNS